MKIAEEGNLEIAYLEMLNVIENDTETKELPDDSEIRQLSGCRNKVNSKRWDRNIDPKVIKRRNYVNITVYSQWRWGNSEANKKDDFLPNMCRDLKHK